MGKYGIPYKGSKSKIAEDILDNLPSGNRLVDLFGGGFAITHCALEKYPNKWNRFFYNDINPLLQPLITDAIQGKYNYDVFKPEWISREEFYKRKEQDGYVKWIWSFGNNGNDYLYGRDIEERKRQVHELIVNDIHYDLTKDIHLTSCNIKDRRLEYSHLMRELKKRDDVVQTQQIERMQQLESLSRLDYRDYRHKDGDVVYCDIPYEDSINKKDYGGGFNHEEFYEWARTRDYPVYYSSYTKGSVIWQKEIRSVMNSSNGAVHRNEVLFRI